MKLISAPKYGSGSVPRVIPEVDTIRRIQPFLTQIGVTRLADTTGLDTLGMPIFSAIRPTDAGMDGISVYNGKGLTKAASRAGAMMEAVERYCAESWSRPSLIGTRAQLQAARPGEAVFDPSDMVLQAEHPYHDDLLLEWGQGWDLLAEQPIWLPLALINTPFRGDGAGYWTCSSNGLAAGNTLEEALSHALAELIERDAYTIATVRAQLVPRMSAFLAALRAGRLSDGRPDRQTTTQSVSIDPDIAPSVRLDTVPAPVARLVRATERDGSQLWLRDMTSDLGIPCFVASMRRVEADGSELAAGGFGCDPSATIAAIRAITEAAQGRNVQIQGVREDASAARGHAPAAERVLWCRDGARWIDFGEVPSYQNADILDDIRLLLDRLRRAGVSQVYAVDVSDPTIPAAVIKVIVPELECWFLHDFADDQSRLGARAQRYLPIA